MHKEKVIMYLGGATYFVKYKDAMSILLNVTQALFQLIPLLKIQILTACTRADYLI